MIHVTLALAWYGRKMWAIVLFQSCITSMLHKLVNLRLEGFFMHPLLAGFIGKEESNSSREGPGPEYNMQRVLKVANIHMIIVCNLNAWTVKAMENQIKVYHQICTDTPPGKIFFLQDVCHHGQHGGGCAWHLQPAFDHICREDHCPESHSCNSSCHHCLCAKLLSHPWSFIFPTGVSTCLVAS